MLPNKLEGISQRVTGPCAASENNIYKVLAVPHPYSMHIFTRSEHRIFILTPSHAILAPTLQLLISVIFRENQIRTDNNKPKGIRRTPEVRFSR
jgi:hypothetical protein